MKNKFNKSYFVLAILVVGLLAQFSYARTPINAISANLNSFSIDEHSNLPTDLVSAQVTVDLVKGVIKLALQPRFNCPAGRFCAQVMPAPHIIELPLEHRYTTRCSTAVYVAEIDDRPVDGARHALTVEDHTSSVCPRPAVHPPIDTTVDYTIQFYDRINGGMVTIQSHLSGGPLTPGR